MCGIQEKDDFALGQVVFAAAVCINEFGLSQRVSFGGCRLAFLKEKRLLLSQSVMPETENLILKRPLAFSTAVWAFGTSQVAKMACNGEAYSWVNFPSEPPLDPPVLSLSK